MGKGQIGQLKQRNGLQSDSSIGLSPRTSSIGRVCGASLEIYSHVPLYDGTSLPA